MIFVLKCNVKRSPDGIFFKRGFCVAERLD